MAYNILILGCGNLGKRYLEGILKSKLDLNIYLVEIDNKVRLDINKNLFELRTKHKIHLHKTINDLKQKRFNILINTTNASGRFELIEKCVFKFKIDNLVLEKILENNIDNLKKFEDLELKNCWVNTFLRSLKIFNQIKRKDHQYIKMKIIGGNWGLCCNSIHYIDLMSWLIDKRPTEILTNKLSEDFVNSKRKGYKEIYGKLKIKYDDLSELELDCDNSSNELKINFESNIMKFEYNLITGEFISEGQVDRYKIPFQSDMSKDLIENILINHNCMLTPLKESIELHNIFLSSMINFWNSVNSENLNFIPIT